KAASRPAEPMGTWDLVQPTAPTDRVEKATMHNNRLRYCTILDSIVYLREMANQLSGRPLSGPGYSTCFGLSFVQCYRHDQLGFAPAGAASLPDVLRRVQFRPPARLVIVSDHPKPPPRQMNNECAGEQPTRSEAHAVPA